MTRPTVLVTGAGGQLGVELQRHAPAAFEVVALDRAALDIGDADAVRAAVAAARPAWIFNAAAYTAVDKAESELASALRINRDGPGHLAAAGRAHGARLVHVSTDFVFAGDKGAPYLPDDPAQPLGAYGRSKHEGELAARAASAGEAVILRTAWVYAAHGGNFVRTMLRLLREKPELRVVADQVGTPTSAATLAQAMWKLAAADVAPGTTLHCTDAGAASWYDFAVAIRELAGARLGRELPPVHPIRTQDYPTPARRPSYSVLDKTALWALIGPGEHWRLPLARVLGELLERP